VRTFTASSGTHYHHDGGFLGGRIRFTIPDADQVVEIPFEDILELVAEFIRERKVSAIEAKSARQILEE
jgi:hypothetical protein